jgi:hypothetical protein
MSVKTLIAMIATVTASFAVPTIVQAAQEKPTMQTATPKPVKTGHAAVNGVNYYYAVYGTGEPLLLLHGGLGQIEMFGPNLTKLAQNRQVIGVDMQGHGRTPLGDRELSLVEMGNDMAGVLKKLGYKRSTCSAIRWVAASRSNSPLSIQKWFAAWCWFPRRSPKTGSIRRCCRCRQRSAPRCWNK